MQRIAAEGEDHGRGVQRSQPAERGPFQTEVQYRVGELKGDEGARREPDHAPEHGGDGEQADHVLVVGGLLLGPHGDGGR